MSRHRPEMSNPVSPYYPETTVNKVLLKKTQILVHSFRDNKIAEGHQTFIIICSSNNEARELEKEIIRTGYGEGLLQVYDEQYHDLMRVRIEKRKIILVGFDDLLCFDTRKLLQGKGNYVLEFNGINTWEQKTMNPEIVQKIMKPTGKLGNFSTSVKDWSLTFIILEMYKQGERNMSWTMRIVRSWAKQSIKSGSWIGIGSDVVNLIAVYNEMICIEWEDYKQVNDRIVEHTTGYGSQFHSTGSYYSCYTTWRIGADGWVESEVDSDFL